MSLNLKDEEARRLARAISEATGQSMSRVIRDALRDRYVRLERHKEKASVEELLAIADRAAAHMSPPCVDHAQLLYDDNGSPK